MFGVHITGGIAESITSLPRFRRRGREDHAPSRRRGRRRAARGLWSSRRRAAQRTRRARETAAWDPALGCARYAREESCSAQPAPVRPSPGHIRHRFKFFDTRKCLRATRFALRWRDFRRRSVASIFSLQDLPSGAGRLQSRKIGTSPKFAIREPVLSALLKNSELFSKL